MLSALIDFFCSSPFPERQKPGERFNPLSMVLAFLNALLWGGLAVAVGWWMGRGGAVALPGEIAQSLAVFSGASPAEAAPYPVLHTLVGLLGASPSIASLNLLGAALFGLLLMGTWGVVRFWVLDAMTDDSIVVSRSWVSVLAANAVCACLLFTLPGLYAVSGLNTATWAFALLPLCAVLQNCYALSGGRKRWMVAFAFALGFLSVESVWVLLFVPIFFVRTLFIEWRLWDHNVRRLPLWFLSLVFGAVLALIWNAVRVCDALTPATLWQTEMAVLTSQLATLRGFVGGAWILNFGAAIFLPLLVWITSRRLLNNDRAWVLLITAAVMTLASASLLFGVRMTPIRGWLASGQIPVGTAWAVAVGFGMILVGWFVQFFAKNPNIYEERDLRHMPKHVTAMRVASFFAVPLTLLALGVTLGMHITRFARLPRNVADRFAGATLQSLPDSYAFLLGVFWLDNHLALSAYSAQRPLTLFSPSRTGEKAYTDDLRRRLSTDPLLGDADRLRLVHLLDYNFLVFVQDFFVSQSNVEHIAASFNLADVWYAAKMRPMPVGLCYRGADEDHRKISKAQVDAVLAQYRQVKQAFADDMGERVLPWFDLTAAMRRNMRYHLAFMANNTGVFLDDMGRLDEAADCYFDAHMLNEGNVSALLNLYDICVRRGRRPERKAEVMHAFETFLRERRKSGVKYDLSAVGRIHGYIRNYDLFVQMGWEWAVSAAPESVLAGLRNAQSGLAPNDPRQGMVQSVVAAVYELQGQTDRSYEGYEAAVKVNPKNVDALRGLLRLSIQKGNAADAGRWLAKAEEAGADQNALDMDRTAYLMAIGDLDGARKAIGRFTKNNKDSAIGWAMLGMLEIEQGNLDRAGGFITENIKRTAKDRDLYFLHILQGRIAQHHAQDAATKAGNSELPEIARSDWQKSARTKWDDARNHYRRAYALRPNVRALLEQILELDRRLEDKVAAEADALAILREDSRHPFANFIVGSQRLEDGYVEEAVKYFRLAVEGSDVEIVDVLNNYADALARTPNTALAEEIALRAVTVANKSYGTWGTYALALARHGDTPKAKVALEKSRGLPGGSDPRLGYVDIWIAINEKQPEIARKALQKLKDALGVRQMPLDRRDIKEIEAKLGL